MKRVIDTANNLLTRFGEKPDIGLVLGSGLQDYAENLESPVRVPYADLPGFPRSTVQGHTGEWVFGRKNKKNVLCMKGRFHSYEGWSMDDVVLPIRVMRELGVGTLILTNASGGVNLDYRPGDLMVMLDHINMSGQNPLVGANKDELGPRFPDMSFAYTPALVRKAFDASLATGVPLKKGVYAMMRGPSFETPAEIRMLRMLGADAVGMSTVPEVIAARHMGMDILGISCITNCAAGVLDQPLSHDEVLAAGREVRPRFEALISDIIARV